MEELVAFLEEVYVPEAKCPYPPHFLWNVGTEVFTGVHGKEDGTKYSWAMAILSVEDLFL